MSDYIARLRRAVQASDDARPRSQQTQIGWSEVAGCRAYLGHKIAGTWVSDDPDTWRAIVGTALHTEVQKCRRDPDSFSPAHEVETSYGGILGHADEVDVDADEVTDFKFPTLAVADSWRSDELVLANKLVQLQGYAAGLVAAGVLTDGCTVRLMVCPVDGTFDDWWCLEQPFDAAVAESALMAVQDVRDLLADGLQPPRDMPWEWCQRFCEFFSVCRDPMPPAEQHLTGEAAALVRRYGEVNEQKKPLEALRKKIAGEIKGIRGVTEDGWRVGLTKVGGTKLVPDLEAAEKLLADLGEQMPTKEVPTSVPSLYVRRVKE